MKAKAFAKQTNINKIYNQMKAKEFQHLMKAREFAKQTNNINKIYNQMKAKEFQLLMKARDFSKQTKKNSNMTSKSASTKYFRKEISLKRLLN